MKVPITVRTISISIAAVATAFVCGIAVTSHQQTVAPFLGSYKAASTTTTDPSTTTAQVSTTAPTSTTTPSTTTTAPSTPLMTTSPSSSTSLSTGTSSTQTTTQPAVTAISAQVTAWSNPVPAATPISATQTMVSYRYCVWTYSDGSTQQATYQTRYGTADPTASNVTTIGVSSVVDPTYDCTIASAPAAN